MYIVAIENEEWHWCASFNSRNEAVRYWRECCINFPSEYDRFAVFYVFLDNAIIVVKDRKDTNTNVKNA